MLKLTLTKINKSCTSTVHY